MKIYEKRDGRILQNCGATIEAAAHDDPDKAKLRNHSGRVFLKDGDNYKVVVKVGLHSYTVATGEAKAAPGRLCSVFVRTRAEADVAEPPAPEVRVVD